MKAGGGMGTLQPMGGGHQRFDSSRQTYSEWQSFMNNHLGDVGTLFVNDLASEIKKVIRNYHV